ncbi:MAG: tRNA-binding protein [Euryarchaeota archaeon]|jgi:tRNA-binding protein|nr:tRNA-binding protein [Euryarchaeota archaeon]MBT4392295.1 tRNA-binding protein [Euryarchaeota archaeon]MBT4802880.1 tRNA-binding protein [Euryarchaeota archaeon]MBT5614305.1 tRNA-binding protein [Euryarchaeota archaeon]MBT6683965.1 tRNA-binding protein [Euryarchaeota archaeon]
MPQHRIDTEELPYLPEKIPKKEYLGIQGFLSLDMRVGEILEVEQFPEMKKPSYKIKVNFGPVIGILWTSAQVTNYSRGELIGRKVVGAINLGDKTLPKGFLSQFLILGALESDGTVQLLQVPSNTLLGSIIS